MADRYLPGDSAPMPLEGQQQKKLIRFDPTFNAGTVAQIIVILCTAATVYTGIKTDQVQQRADLEAVKASALNERLATKESLTDLKADVKELSKGMNEVKESIAILRGRSTDKATK